MGLLSLLTSPIAASLSDPLPLSLVSEGGEGRVVCPPCSTGIAVPFGTDSEGLDGIRDGSEVVEEFKSEMAAEEAGPSGRFFAIEPRCRFARALSGDTHSLRSTSTT